MITITKEFVFHAAHRLMLHEGNCKNIHGHEYKLLVDVISDACLDKSGMIVDFGILKQVIKTWLDTHLDHALILNAKDAELIDFLEEHDMKYFILQCEPTVENMVRFLCGEISKLLRTIQDKSESSDTTKSLCLHSMTLYETKDSYCTLC